MSSPAGAPSTGGTTSTVGAPSTGGTTSTVGAPLAVTQSIATGHDYTCTVLSGGTVQCWGTNNVGQLGNGTRANSSPVPTTVFGITNAIAVAAGNDQTCAVLSGGTVQCWGSNLYGQLGAAGYTATGSSVPVTVSGITNAIAVSAGDSDIWGAHTCALLNGGTIKCWGYGELGDGASDATRTSVVVTVSGITNAIAVSAGLESTCAVLSGGTVQCWGNNEYGQLGNDSTMKNSLVPVTVSGITNAIAVSCGWDRACAVLSGGTVQCWGGAYLGNGSANSSLGPVAVTGITNAIAVSAGFRDCALLNDGTVQCWGLNQQGALGNGTMIDSLVPVTVSGITNATAVATGFSHSCALLNGGSVKCWGDNTYGELGNDTTTSSLVPVTVSGF